MVQRKKPVLCLTFDNMGEALNVSRGKAAGHVGAGYYGRLPESLTPAQDI
jgi:hypothetical protein